MIEILSGLPDGTLGFKISGRVTGDDYDSVLTPAIDEAMEKFERIKLLVQIGPDFEGYSMDAAWDDTKLAMRHWTGFMRIAVATDASWVRTGVKAMGFMMPCPIQLFDLDEADDARRWLEESLGSIHASNEGDIITVRLLGKLEPSAYDGMDDELDNLISKAEHPRLLLDLREFDGWSGLSALSDHLSLIREHRKAPERIAVVGDKAWQNLAEKVMSRFVNAHTKFFDGDDFNGAAAWIAA